MSLLNNLIFSSINEETNNDHDEQFVENTKLHETEKVKMP